MKEIARDADNIMQKDTYYESCFMIVKYYK